MSHHIVNLAVLEDMPATRKIVLLILAHAAMQSTGLVNFETKALAKACGLSPSSAREQTKALAESAHIDILHRNPDKSWAYRVLVWRPIVDDGC